MGAPGRGVAGHEEGDCCVGEGGGWSGELVVGLVLVSEVGEDVDDAALVDLRRIAGQEEVDGQDEGDDEFAGWWGRGGEKIGEGACREDVEEGEDGVEETDFFVGDEA